MQTLQSGKLALFPQCLEASFFAHRAACKHCSQGSWPSFGNVCRPPALHIGQPANIAVREAGPLRNVCRPPSLQIGWLENIAVREASPLAAMFAGLLLCLHRGQLANIASGRLFLQCLQAYSFVYTEGSLQVFVKTFVTLSNETLLSQ